MSAIETVQKAYAAFGQGDMETLTTLMSDDYVAILPESMPNGGTFNGANDFIQNCLSKIVPLSEKPRVNPQAAAGGTLGGRP